MGEVAGDAFDGVAVFLDEAGEVLGGLVLLAVKDRVVTIEDATVVCGEDNFGGDRDEIAGGLAGGGVVGEGGDGLGENGAAKSSVGVGGGRVEDLVFGAGVEFADGGLGEGHLSVEGLGVGGEDGYSEGADVGGDVSCGASLVIAASGEDQGEAGKDGA